MGARAPVRGACVSAIAIAIWTPVECTTGIVPIPTQFKATQLVVAIAVWATQRSYPDFNLSILLLNNASEQYYITIG